jgi:hypothetical protein
MKELIHSCLHDDPSKRPTALYLLKNFKTYFSSKLNSISLLAFINETQQILPENEEKIKVFHVKSNDINQIQTMISQWNFDFKKSYIDEVKKTNFQKRKSMEQSELNDKNENNEVFIESFICEKESPENDLFQKSEIAAKIISINSNDNIKNDISYEEELLAVSPISIDSTIFDKNILLPLLPPKSHETLESFNTRIKYLK